ncbi:exosome complex component RRP45 [Paragonimus westermani]|uniref:Exosome complex component RRP45 n=1 Tax=Paragonimus westermani TaxID=34504 RepID=A0A5J4NBJ3_9TREM|nr:exosome complex component RRP45 [Paragonimus westermani]
MDMFFFMYGSHANTKELFPVSLIFIGMSNAEAVTLEKLLLSGYRLDGRSLNEYREVTFRFPRISTDDDSGCCTVNIGATSVVAHVTVEVVEPKSFRPSQGMMFLNFDTSLVNVSKNSQRKNNRDDESRRLSAVLQTLLRDCIDLDALCIVAWERVFAVRVELRALSYDGNLGDCGALAAIAALAAFRRPDVFVQDDGKVIVDFDARHRPRVPLGIRRIPVLVTLGLTADSRVILHDACAREDPILLGGRVMVGMTGFAEVCCLYTCGLTKPMRSDKLIKCVQLASSSAQSLIAFVQRALSGLNKQYEIRRAAAHARSSELCPSAISQPACHAPLVLSSTNFLLSTATDENAPSEEGQIVDQLSDFCSDTDMDIAVSDVDEAAEPVASPIDSELKLKSRYLEPYGVIEIPSLTLENSVLNDPTNAWSDDFEGALEVPGIVPSTDTVLESTKTAIVQRFEPVIDEQPIFKNKPKKRKAKQKIKQT